MQKRAFGGTSTPHIEHARANAAPQPMQNAAASGFAVEQSVQVSIVYVTALLTSAPSDCNVALHG